MKAKVSIIVPVYNKEEYIGDCLTNLVKQTLDEIEIICVNDGSKDRSLEIINDYIKKDPRIKVISQENGGLSAARNTGIDHVRTPFVMFCDADDIFSENMCEKMLKAINDVDIAACGTEVIYQAHSEIEESDNNYYRIKFSGKNYINDNIISRTDVSVCNKIFRTEIIKKNEIRFPEKLNNEDYYFYNAYMSIAKTIFFVSQKLYKYVRHDNSIMSANFDHSAYSPDHLLVAKKLFNFYKKSNFLNKHTNLFWNQFSESFWFSYNHSAKKYRNDLIKIAKDFIDKNYEKYLPTDPKTKRNIFVIAHNSLVHKIVRKIKGKAARIYRKINIAYRQQDYINKNIEKLEQELYEIAEKVNNLGSKNG